MSQELQISKTSSSNNPISTLNENELSYRPATTLPDFAQQALIDVNSQPLIQNIMENHQLINHHLNESSNVLLTSENPALPQSGEGTTPENVIDPNSPIITEFYEKFPTGRMFQSLEALRNETYEYGRRHNVALTTSKSDKTKIYLICKHGGRYRKNTKASQSNRVIKPRVRRSQKTGCACMIYARCCRGSFWIIRKSVGEHNHPIANDPRAYSMYRSLTPENLLIVHRLLREHVGISLIVKSLKANGVANILAKDIENIQQDMKRREVLELPTNDLDSTSSTIAQDSSAVVTPIPTSTLLGFPDTTALITPSPSNTKEETILNNEGNQIYDLTTNDDPNSTSKTD